MGSVRGFVSVSFFLFFALVHSSIAQAQECVDGTTKTEYEVGPDSYTIITYECICEIWAHKKSDTYETVVCGEEREWMLTSDISWDYDKSYYTFTGTILHCESIETKMTSKSFRKALAEYYGSCIWGRSPPSIHKVCVDLKDSEETTTHYREVYDWGGGRKEWELLYYEYKNRYEYLDLLECPVPYQMIARGYEVDVEEEHYCEYPNIPDAGNDCAGPRV